MLLLFVCVCVLVVASLQLANLYLEQNKWEEVSDDSNGYRTWMGEYEMSVTFTVVVLSISIKDT